MDNNELIRQANNIVKDYINKTKQRKKNTVLKRNTVINYIAVILVFAALLLLIISITNFILWQTL